MLLTKEGRRTFQREGGTRDNSPLAVNYRWRIPGGEKGGGKKGQGIRGGNFYKSGNLNTPERVRSDLNGLRVWAVLKTQGQKSQVYFFYKDPKVGCKRSSGGRPRSPIHRRLLFLPPSLSLFPLFPHSPNVSDGLRR